MKREDLRYMRTEDAIQTAFFECVRTVGYEKTNVALLCRLANINRKTFYDHYLDKEDLLDNLYRKMEKSLINTMKEISINKFDMARYYTMSNPFIYNIAENSQLFVALHKCYPRRVTDVFIKLYKHNMQLLIPDFEQTFAKEPFIKARFEYGAGGTVRLISEWFVKERASTINDLTSTCNRLWKTTSNAILQHIASIDPSSVSGLNLKI